MKSAIGRAVITVGAAALVVGSAGAAAADPPGRVALGGTGGGIFVSGLTDEGLAPADFRIAQRVYLGVNNAQRLERDAQAVSSPGSAAYGRNLTPDQIRSRFQLDARQMAAVRSWLASAGLSVSQDDWRSVLIEGNIVQLSRAFGTTYHRYRFDERDEFVIANTDLTVPARLRDLVIGVSSTMIYVKGGTAASDPSATGGTHEGPVTRSGTVFGGGALQTLQQDSATCSEYWGQRLATDLPPAYGKVQPWVPCGYTPGQLRRAYGLDDADLTGRGVTVAVVVPSWHTLEQDVNTWSDRVGVAKLRPGQLTRVTPGSRSPDDQQYDPIAMVESTMDVEAVHGMAPDADIVSVGLSDRTDYSVADSFIHIVDDTPASIVSLSAATGKTPSMSKVLDQVFQQGALRGVGFYMSSGDGGHDPAGNFAAFPASSSWVTAVGGTSLAIGADGHRLWETGWGNASATLSGDSTSWGPLPGDSGGGAGGGRIDGSPQPWYQRGVVPDVLAVAGAGGKVRVAPDIAMDADDTTGMLVGGVPIGVLKGWDPTSEADPDPAAGQYAEARGGGTSLSAPLFAGVQALAEQASGRAVGFANPAIYHRHGTATLRDITTYTDPDGSPPAAVKRSILSSDSSLVSVLGRMPVTDGVPTPATAPGFDTVTGVGVPSGRYPRSFAADQRSR